MEDFVYVCRWRFDADGYSLWHKDRPKCRARGQTLEQAEESLILAIQKRRGAVTPIFEFDPPLPPGELNGLLTVPRLLIVGGDESFDPTGPHRTTVMDTATAASIPNDQLLERIREHNAWRVAEDERRRAWADSFFEKPPCRNCRQATSRRTSRPLELTHSLTRADGALGFLSHYGGAVARIFSEQFLDILAPAERSSLQFQGVVLKRSKRKFYELIGPEGIPYVHVRDLPCTGWKCPECGYRIWGYWKGGISFNRVVAQADLPSPLPSLFTIGTLPEIELCLTAERWSELVGRTGTRQFVSSPVGVISNDRMLSEPELAPRIFNWNANPAAALSSAARDAGGA